MCIAIIIIIAIVIGHVINETTVTSLHMRLPRSLIQHSDELPRADIFIGEMAAAATVRYEY